jgi:glutaredoxin 3
MKGCLEREGSPLVWIALRRNTEPVPRIEIYTQPWCPYCSRAVNLLTRKGIAFEEIDAPHGSAERAQAVQRSGGRTSVPQIFVGETHVGGCDDLMALERAGKLDALLAA